MPLGAWWTQGGMIAMIAILAVALYGFHVSRAGKLIFGGNALEL
jgi:hypothetical protein